MSRFEPIAVAAGHTNPNIKPLAQAWGDQVTVTNLAESAGPNIQRAGLWSTAPMIDWEARKAAIVTAEAEAAAAVAAKEQATREVNERRWSKVSVAVRRACALETCKAPARHDSDFCRWHQPKEEAD